MRKLFGTDGVRGVANQDPMTSEMALRIGRAAAHVFRDSSRRHRVVIGKDTRLSGYMIESALTSGLCSMGMDVLLVGPVPTPGIAFLTRSLRADAGVVISASHNPYEDNGIKFFGRDGFKLPDEVEKKMEDLVFSGAIDAIRTTACGWMPGTSPGITSKGTISPQTIRLLVGRPAGEAPKGAPVARV